jgi:hypothetical protein
MSVGFSGRIVIEIDPDVKSELYELLRDRRMTLKDWFLEHVQVELERRGQMALEFQEGGAAQIGTPRPVDD